MTARRVATKVSKKDKTPSKQDAKAPTATNKKLTPVISGLMKFAAKNGSPVAQKDLLSKPLEDYLRSDSKSAVSLRERIFQKGWIGSNWKTTLTTAEIAAVLGAVDLTEAEMKASRTWFPYLGQPKTAEDRKVFWLGKDNVLPSEENWPKKEAITLPPSQTVKAPDGGKSESSRPNPDPDQGST